MKINCENNNERTQIRWVRGNTQPLSIPLEQEVMTENEEIRTEPYYPSESDKVTVYLVGRFKRKAFTPEIDGNVLIIHEDGTLSTGSYHVEVLIEHQDGKRNRSLWCNQVVITESNDTVLQEWDEFKQQEPQARAAIFFFAKGDKGDPFTYEDFTQEQIEDLKKPAVDAAAELTDEVHALESEFTESENERVANENQRVANEIARENAETSREQQSASDHTTALADHTTSVSDHTTAQSDHTTALSDHTQASSDHVTASGDHTRAEFDHALATVDHTTATSDHETAVQDNSQMTELVERADADHVQADADHATAESDHTTATSDHTQAATDHNAATLDHSTATSDHATASNDHTTAQSDHATATNDHDTATTDHQTAVSDHSIADGDHTLASADHTTALADHNQADSDHTRAENDNATATSDHTSAVGDHTTAAADHTQAVSDHTTAAADHTTAESDHAAVEVYVDSLGVFDLSKHNAVGGVLATYADLSAALTALNALDSKYKYGGMSFKFVQTSDSKYVQYRYIGTSTVNADFINANNWVGQAVDIKHNRIPRKEIIINSDNNEEIIRINEDGVHVKDLSVNNRNIIIEIDKKQNKLPDLNIQKKGRGSKFSIVDENNISILRLESEGAYVKRIQTEDGYVDMKLFERYSLSDFVIDRPVFQQNKTAVFFGDSITFGVGASATNKRFTSVLCNLSGFVETNKGISGGVLDPVIAEETSHGDITNKIKTTDISAYDYVFIAGGTNDVGLGVTYNRLYDVVMSLCDWISLNKGNAKIYFITPINKIIGKNKNCTLDDARRAIAEAAIQYDFNILNGESIPFPSYQSHWSSIVLPDGLHPSDIGHNVYARYLFYKLNY